jgi:GT2 family glycosyltransferase
MISSGDTLTGNPSFEIVIPNWNGAKMLGDCLNSLYGQSYQNFMITVVDNGSTDDSLAMLARDYPAVRVLSYAENRGFSAAVNAGIRKARAPWILLLNNDMEVEENCLLKLLEGIVDFPDADFFALKMYNFHNRELLDGAGDAMLRGGVGYRIGVMEHDGERYSFDRLCFGACAGAALYSRRFFERVGYFDEDFFAYVEDVDLNLRAARAGVCCVFLSQAKIYHIGSATSGSKFNELTIRLSTRNNINLMVKNYPSLLFLRFLPAIIIYQCLWLLFCIKKGVFVPWFRGVCEALSPRSLGLFYGKHSEQLADASRENLRLLGNRIVASEREAVTSIMARRNENGRSNRLLRLYLKLFC